VLEHHVTVQRARLDFADVSTVGMDETSAAKGQDYVTVFMDLVARFVLFATEGRDAATVEAFAEDLVAHGGDPANITNTSSDMSPAFICGIGEHLPNAEMTFDRYHVIAKLNEAIDEVRRAEQKHNPGAEEDPLRVAEEPPEPDRQATRDPGLAHPSVAAPRDRAGPPLARGLSGVLRPGRRRRRGLPAQLALRREAISPATGQGLRQPRRAPLGRDHLLAPKPHQQRPAGGNQLPHPGGKGAGTRLPEQITIIYLIAGKLPLPSPHVTHSI